MLAWLRVAVMDYLLLLSHVSSMGVAVTERRFAAEGSSVLMDAPDIKNVNFTEWEYIRNGTSEVILQCYAGHQQPTVYAAYQGRVDFYPENGSLLLQGLRETDSGFYKATVDLMRNKARTTFLEVLKPVPQPELRRSSNLAGSPIELLCVLPEGTVASISWKKEGRPIPPEKCYHLPFENITVLQIRSGEKLDCGSFSCNVSNEISWKEAALNLTVTGLTPPLRHVQRLAIVALMFVTVSAVGFIIAPCRLRERRFGDEAQKHVVVSAHGLLCISSLLLLAISITWMWEEGLSVAFVLLGLFFGAAAIGAVQATGAVRRPTALSCFETSTWHCVIRSLTAPTTLVVNLLFAVLLLHNIQQLHERGCSEAVDQPLVVSCIIAAAAIVTLLLLFLLWYHRNRRKKMMRMEKEHAVRSTQVTATLVVEETQGQKQEEE